MKTILMTAYAVNPYKGSEDGTGWNICLQVAKSNRVIVVTRENNQTAIEQYMTEFPSDIYSNMDFLYFDLPQWAMWWKKKIGERGYVLYYYLWQLFMPVFIWSKKVSFDIAHCVNFHSDSHPHFLWMLRKPVFWGPVGHHPPVPKQYIRDIYGLSTYLKDNVYFVVKWMMRNLDPFYFLAVRFSEKIFIINSGVSGVMGASKEKTILLPAVASKYVPPMKFNRDKKKFTVLSVGRFTYMKGFDIAINSFKSFLAQVPTIQRPDVKLVLVGKGEEKERLMQLANEEVQSGNIEFVSWVAHEEMPDLYRKADLFLFPSHEGAGMVVPEAMSYGVPVLCFDNYGPGELVGNAGLKVSYDQSYQATITRFAAMIAKTYEDPDLREALSLKAYNRYSEKFTWERKGAIVKEAYEVLEVKKDKQSIAVFHPSSELYGADRILVNALNAYPESTHKHVYLYRRGPLEQYLKDHVANVFLQVDERLPYIHRSIMSPIGIISFVVRWFRFLWFFNTERKEKHFDHVYYNTLACSFMLPVTKLFRVKSFVHVHEIIERPYFIGKVTALLAAQFADKVICVSNAVSEQLIMYKDEIKDKIAVLHNGIDPINTVRKEKEDKLKFYLFGRIMEKKGQWFLVEALSLIPKKLLEQCEVVLMGGAVPGKEDDLQRLAEEIRVRELDAIVSIEPFAPNIAMAMSQADICLVPSMMKDPFPTTVLEAMSAGKPVIATNHGGAKEVICHGQNGYLVGKNDTKALAECITSFIIKRDKIEPYSQHAKQTFESNFNKDLFNSKWKNMLKNLTTAHGSAFREKNTNQNSMGFLAT